MAEFGFTEAQEMLRQEARTFAQRELAPGARERHKLGYVPQEIKQRIIAMGWNALNCPAKYGGQPIDYVSIGILNEEISKVDTLVAPYVFINSELALELQYLPQEIQDELFPPLLSLAKQHCRGWTEAEAGSDAAAIQTRAIRDGDYYIINGEKQPVTFGMRADFMIVTAKTDSAAGHKGITMFWVPLDLPGITRTPIPWMGLKHHAAAIINLDNVRLPARYRMGEEGQGFYLFVGILDWIKPAGLALGQLGVAQATLEEAMVWAKQRIAFGRPISKFEGVSFKIAEHYTRVEAARLLCYRTLWLRDQGLPHAKESAMSKWFRVEVVHRAILDCMIIFGHVGYSEEHPIPERLTEVSGWEIGDGTEQIQKLIIARELMGKDAVPY